MECQDLPLNGHFAAHPFGNAAAAAVPEVHARAVVDVPVSPLVLSQPRIAELGQVSHPYRVAVQSIGFYPRAKRMRSA